MVCPHGRGTAEPTEPTGTRRSRRGHDGADGDTHGRLGGWWGHTFLVIVLPTGDRVSDRRRVFHEDILNGKEPISGVGLKWCVPAVAGLRSGRYRRGYTRVPTGTHPWRVAGTHMFGSHVWFAGDRVATVFRMESRCCRNALVVAEGASVGAR